jgi:benzoyl-CoA reductase/2-hydroxyglutaryl-CoA dehydratase subunit BcrC/BadD/HgdB
MTAGYICSGFPAAVAAGMGLRPVRVLQGTSGRMEDAGSERVRPDICPFVKVVLGGTASGSGIFGEIDLWMGLSTCDHTRRCFAALSLSASVYPIQLPSTVTDGSLEYYQWQIGDLVRRAEEITGRKYSEERALEYAVMKHEAGRVLVEAVLGSNLSPMDLHLLLHLYHISDPAGLAAVLASLLKTAEEFRPSGVVGITGSILSLEDTHVTRILEERRVGMIPLGCCGLQSLPFMGLNTVPSSGSPEDLAGESFLSMRCPRCRPNRRTFDYLEESARQTGCRGLLVKTLKFCDLWYTERVRLRERMELPVLVMDTSYGPGEASRQANRIESFLETLDL